MMKIVFLIFTFQLLELSVGAQPDTIIGENIANYKILNGRITSTKQVFEQNTYDLTGRLLWQIVFRDSSMTIKNFTRFFYEDDKLVSEETFDGSNDSIAEIKRFSYGPNGMVSKLSHYKPVGGVLKLNEKINYSYADTLLVKKDTYNPKNKWLAKTSITYSENEISELTNFRKGYRSDDLKSSQKTSTMAMGKILRVEIKDITYKNDVELTFIEFEYDSTLNKVSREIRRNDADTVPQIIEYRYRPDGTKMAECIVDENQNYLQFIGFDRKKYPVTRKKLEMYNLEIVD